MAVADEKPLDIKSIRFDVTVPCDERFRSMLDKIASRMIAYLGYEESDAAELTNVIEHATDGVLAHEDGASYTSLDVTFATSETEMEIRIRYLLESADARAAERLSIERVLSRRAAGEAPLDFIQRVMPRVEFGREDGVDFCTLVKALPEET